jgi:hypothetical protein
MAKLIYKINAKYQNSRPVNYNRWSDCPEVIGLVEEIMTNFTASREVAGYKLNMLVLVLDLFESWYFDSEQQLGYYRNHNHYNFKRRVGVDDRYVLNPHITATCFVGAVKHLITNCHVINHPGGQFRDDFGNVVAAFVSRIEPTEKFVTLCQKHKLTIDMVGKFSDAELIILKPEKDKRTQKQKDIDELAGMPKISTAPVAYTDNINTRCMRRIVRTYNALMDNTYLDVDAECLSAADRDELVNDLTQYDVENPDIILKLSKNNVYRVFNNGDVTFTQGGRYYGAWWVGCPGILRRYITINGNPTVELDYSGIHIQLLYALKGVNFAALKQDAYELDDGIPDRYLNKLILLTAINATGEPKTASSVFNELREDGLLSKYGITDHKPIKCKLDLLKLKHHIIQDYIASGKGIALQYYDSLVIEQLIDHFASRNIPILTIHDSIVCETQYARQVKEKMLELYIATVNSKLRPYILKSVPDKRKVKFPHIKYQRTYTPIPKWQQIISKPINIINTVAELPDQLKSNIKITDASIDYFLRTDTNIIIKQEQRHNSCRSNCSMFKRISEYQKHGGIPFRRTIKLKLDKLKGVNILRIL